MSTRHPTTEDGERIAQALAGPSYLPPSDNSVIGVAVGIGVTDLATGTTASSATWSDPWPCPLSDQQPTRAQADLLGVLHDLVTEYAQTGGPPTALLCAVREAYQAGLHPGAPR